MGLWKSRVLVPGPCWCPTWLGEVVRVDRTAQLVRRTWSNEKWIICWTTGLSKQLRLAWVRECLMACVALVANLEVSNLTTNIPCHQKMWWSVLLPVNIDNKDPHILSVLSRIIHDQLASRLAHRISDSHVNVGHCPDQRQGGLLYSIWGQSLLLGDSGDLIIELTLIYCWVIHAKGLN